MILSKLSEILGRKKLKLSNVIRDTRISRPTLTNLYYNVGKGINFDTLSTLCAYLSITTSDLLVYYNVDVDAIGVNLLNKKFATTTVQNKTINYLTNLDIDGIIVFRQKTIPDIKFAGVFNKLNDSEYELTITGFHDATHPIVNYDDTLTDFLKYEIMDSTRSMILSKYQLQKPFQILPTIEFQCG